MDGAKPIPRARVFAPELPYDDVDWSSFAGPLASGKRASVTDAFEASLRSWYVDPMRTLARETNSGFSSTALAALLIDTLSRYSADPQVLGATAGRQTFITYLKVSIPEFKQPVSSAFTGMAGNNTVRVDTFADAFYFGIRCGVLHVAHPYPYIGLWHDGPVVGETPVDAWEHDQQERKAVVVNPKELVDRVEDLFGAYVTSLRQSSPADGIQTQFRQTFESIYGFSI